MASGGLLEPLAAEQVLVNKALREMLSRERGIPVRLRRAMRHSLLGGGKRLRPIILLWTWDAVAAGGGRPQAGRTAALEAGCALEMIHTYSLIHDDLPAMDDDVLRRGKPTCHVAFDEATAILAGDALQALGFQHLASAAGKKAGGLVAMIARAVGPAGMVGGQQEDLDSEGTDADARLVRRIHLRKTAALLAASFSAGAYLGGAAEDVVSGLERAGRQLGLAFQAADDLLDATATSEQLGKSTGKDAAAAKATLIRAEGMKNARRRMERQGRSGLAGIRRVLAPSPARDRLIALGELMWDRDR